MPALLEVLTRLSLVYCVKEIMKISNGALETLCVNSTFSWDFDPSPRSLLFMGK